MRHLKRFGGPAHTPSSNPTRAPGARLGTLVASGLCLVLAGCGGLSGAPRPDEPSAPVVASVRTVRAWMTTPDGRLALTPRRAARLVPRSSGPPDLRVRNRQRHQQFFGVGASLTGASATLLRSLPADRRAKVLRDLFDPGRGIGLSLLRQPLGANDFSVGTFSYDDVPSGGSDPDLTGFSLNDDGSLVVPLLRRAARINPSLAVVLSPWSAPAWMKTSGSMVGGTLRPELTDVYAHYLVRSVQAYADAGVPVSGLSVQNEPFFSPPGYAGMTLDVEQQRDLIDNHLTPALAAAGLAPHVWALDDNWARWPEADALLSSPTTRPNVYGVAFHCYRGDVSALREIRDRHPDVPVSVSECSGGRWGTGFAGDLAWEAHTMLVGAIGNGASWLAKWNLALDPRGGPTNGGCRSCTGLVTIDPGAGVVERSATYYAWGHVGRFVTPGATVVGTGSSRPEIETVAFQNPDGSHVLLAHNRSAGSQRVTVGVGRRSFSTRLPAGALATYTW